MPFEQDLRQHLLNKMDLIAYVDDRIYPVVRPQGGLLPAITYRRATGGHTQRLSASGDRAQPLVEFDIYSEDYGEAKAISQELRLALQGLVGAVGFDTTITACLDVDESDAYEVPQDGSDAGAFVVTRQFEIQYREAYVAAPTP